MSEQIVFRGVVLWDRAVNGAGWDFQPSPLVEDAVELRAPLGTGHWVKPAGVAEASHLLRVQWRTQDKASLLVLLESLAAVELGDLVVPGWGTLPNCRLRGVGELESFRSDGATGYIVSASLDFVQYP